MRTIHSLNGQWDFLPLPDLPALRCHPVPPGDEAHWQKIGVPGYWDGGGWFNMFGRFVYQNGFHPGFAKAPFPDLKTAAWYRRRFTLGNTAGYRVLLQFHAVAAKAIVYVNQSRAGEHLGAFTPFAFDITPLVREGENCLAVQVLHKNLFWKRKYSREFHQHYHATQIGLGENKFCGGIWQSVELVLAPASGLDDVQVIPVRHGLKVWASIKLADRLPDCGLQVQVRDERRILAGTAIKVCAWNTVRAPRAEPWSPENPRLYEAVVTLLQRGRAVDQLAFRVGFRDFAVRGRRLRLNGQPCFVRGASLPAHGLIAEDERYIREFLQRVKRLNINTLTSSQEPFPDKWLALCDETGLMAWDQFAYAWRLPPMEFAVQECREWMRARLHHPSLVVWNPAHEAGYDLHFLPHRKKYRTPNHYLRELRKHLVKIDRSRPMIGDMGVNRGADGAQPNDIETWTRYHGWYLYFTYAQTGIVGNQVPQEVLDEGVPCPDRTFEDINLLRGIHYDRRRPLLFSEPIAAYSASDDGHFYQKPFSMRRVGGHGKGYEEASLAYQAFLSKETIEIFRRARLHRPEICGLDALTVANWWFSPLQEDLLAEKPVADAIATAMHPFLVSAECWRRHVAAGEMLAADLYAIHEDAAWPVLDDVTVTCELISPSGQVIPLGTAPFGRLRYGSIRKRPFRTRLPVELGMGAYRLLMKALAGRRLVASNALDLRVYPANWQRIRHRPLADQRPLYLYDPARLTAHILREMDVGFQSVVSFGSLGAADSLLIGRNALAHLPSGAWPVLRARVRKGLCLVCLEQSVPPKREHLAIPLIAGAPLHIIRERHPKLSSYEADDVAHLQAPNHPVFANLHQSDFRWWNGDTVLISNYLTQDYSPGRLRGFLDRRIRQHPAITPLASCFTYLRDDAVIQVRLGKGLALFSQLEAVRRFRRDPVATKYLYNLLTYAVSREDHWV